MTETISPLPEQIDTQQLVQQLVDRARTEGVDNTFRYASRRDWDALGKQLRPIYTAPTAAAAVDRFDEFAQAWGGQYPAVVGLWRSVRAPSAQRALSSPHHIRRCRGARSSAHSADRAR